MEQNEIKQGSIKLMETADVAYLSTVDSNGFPQTRAMVNLRNKEQFSGLVDVFKGHEEDFMIYMTTDNVSKKFKQIGENSKVSVYFCDPKQIQGLLLTGEVEVVTDNTIKRQLWQEDWKVHYPGGIDGPEYNILRLLPKNAEYWAVPMPEVTEFNIT